MAPIVSWWKSSGTTTSTMSARSAIWRSNRRRVLSRPGSSTSVGRAIASDLDLVAELDGAVRRDAEEGLGCRGAVRQRDEEGAAPLAEPATVRGHERFAAEGRA